MKKNNDQMHVAVVGGCGHVGLPLGVKFALAGLKTTLIDIDQKATETVMRGKFPFLENGGDKQLQDALKLGLTATADPSSVSTANVVIFVTGTPVDEHLNPKLADVTKIFSSYEKYFQADTLVVMRSTLFPGTMEHLYKRSQKSALPIHLAFCPERVAQGYALDEIDSLPQIVSSFDEKSFELARNLFLKIAPEVIRLTPLEAEMTKLMANSWRYLEFAIANQFYMIAESNGIDFFKIYQAIRHDYPRAKGYKAPGLTAGPCLFKDTMQLASFFDHEFYLGHSAMLVNEGLATFLVNKAKQQLNNSLWGKKIGILGLTFKADNDDIRESLSYKVKKSLEFSGADVVCHDPYRIQDSTDLDKVLAESALVILCAPHSEYRDLKLKIPFVDCWGVWHQPKLETFKSESI
jgi:UDP-N-acetyl-D-mannosaminuronic acid dehydrogenase